MDAPKANPREVPEVKPDDCPEEDRKPRVACFLDIPNLETSSYQVGADCDPAEILAYAATQGKVIIAKAYGFATIRKPISRGVMAAFQAGFEFIPTVLVDEGRKDVDTRMISDIVQSIYENNIDVIVIASGDSDYVPAMKLARRKGISVIIFAIEACFSPGLTHEADHLIIIPKKMVDEESVSLDKPMVPA